MKSKSSKSIKITSHHQVRLKGCYEQDDDDDDDGGDFKTNIIELIN